MAVLYLHIGLPKTGTTAIQLFCERNVEALRRKGYDYPMFEKRFDQATLHRNGHFLISEIMDGDQENIKKQNEILEAGLEKVRESFEKYDFVILSDESIWNTVIHRESAHGLWDKLKQHADGCNYQIKLIVYLRRQDEYAAAWLAQKVMGRNEKYGTMTWEEFETMTDVISPDYYERLENLARDFGKENLIVRPYDRDRFPDGKIENDFFRCIGLSIDDGFVPNEENINVSLDGTYSEMQRLLNMLDYQKEFKRTYSKAARQCTLLTKEKTSALSKAERERFIERYKESNAKVAREYMNLGTDEPFSYEIKDIPKWDEDMVNMMEHMVLFFGEMARRQELDFVQLRETVKQQEADIEKLKKMVGQHEKTIINIKNPLRYFLKKVKKQNDTR